MSMPNIDRKIERLLSADYSVGTETFRDKLLERCLAALSTEDGVFELDDDQFDMLAAAGDPSLLNLDMPEG